MEKLVALQASNDPHGSRGVDVLEEPTVDFAAATTATLGVPTPSASQLWSSETSFEELTNEMNQEEMTESAKERRRKGDSEEARQLLQVRTSGGCRVSSTICLYCHLVGSLQIVIIQYSPQILETLQCFMLGWSASRSCSHQVWCGASCEACRTTRRFTDDRINMLWVMV